MYLKTKQGYMRACTCTHSQKIYNTYCYSTTAVVISESASALCYTHIVCLLKVLYFFQDFSSRVAAKFPLLCCWLQANRCGNWSALESDTECIAIFITQIHMHLQIAYWAPWVDRYNLTFRSSVTKVSNPVCFLAGFRTL